MNVRTNKFEPLRATAFILVFAAAAFTAGCANNPRTALDWGVNERFTAKTPNARPIPRPATKIATKTATTRKVYVYKETAEADSPDVVPKTRPANYPAWYQDRACNKPRPQPDAQIQPANYTTNADPRFAWPVNGQVISDFGSTTEGERNDGINIAAAYGEPIRASADGTVSYTGDLKSYGNLVLIRHDDNYITAYAHADRVLVNRGDHVAKGQVIAYAGSSGDVKRPQLHFEIRRGVKPINPRQFLVASR